ncbi:MAG TPA: hypothetical protein VFA77_12755 [Candidatus Eisenbacteria bacterium]|jgi:hypothetical protein|nr:hypothetical protein [Candidatus Eisenbacteria bacterium]
MTPDGEKRCYSVFEVQVAHIGSGTHDAQATRALLIRTNGTAFISIFYSPFSLRFHVEVVEKPRKREKGDYVTNSPQKVKPLTTV